MNTIQELAAFCAQFSPFDFNLLFNSSVIHDVLFNCILFFFDRLDLGLDIQRRVPRPSRGLIIVHVALEFRRPLLHEALNTLLCISAIDQVMEKLTLKQMSLLRRLGVVNHQILHDLEGRNAHIQSNVIRNLQRRGQDLIRRHDLAKDAIQQLVRSGIHSSRTNEMHGATDANQPRQVKATAGLHAEPSPAKDEAHLGVLVDHPHRRGERHSHSHADGRAIDGADDGFGAPRHGEGGLSARVAVGGLAVFVLAMAGVEVHAGAIEAVGGVRGGEDDGADAGVGGQRVVGGDEVFGHLVGPGMAGGRTIEVHDDDGGDRGGGRGVVAEFEGGEGEGVVVVWIGHFGG